MARYDAQNKRSALDEERLRELALAYVGRFATTRVRLERYLARKLRERGWAGDDAGGRAEIERIAVRFVELGYVNDEAYARAKGAAMERRGLGIRRISESLRADGVGEDDRVEAEEQARGGRWDAADTLARKKRIGPYAKASAEPAMREKQIAAFLRAGHDFATARAWVHAAPGEFPERSE